MTRRRILDSARHLFGRDGYAATTLKAVAADAGVAVQTVYAVFGSKAAILAELRSLVVSLPEADRSYQAAMREPTIEGRLTGFAHSIRQRWEHAGDIITINEDAARADPSVRSGVGAARERRQAGIAAFVAGIAEDLVPGIDVARTTALVDALSLYDLYVQLVAVHGWSQEAYEAWLRAQLISNVIQPSGA